MKYRPEIDGLRAVALLPVIFFHAGISFFSGGYVGVDVFFVISGYLITTIIFSEKEAGTFTFGSFYERRVRRIFPALTVVLLACIPFVWLWMLPSQMIEFSQSLIAVPLFLSNILFWLQSGYFAPNIELKPLLHTWSLAVEEQYYLFFPLFIMLIWRFGKRTLVVIFAALGIASMMLAQWGSIYHSSANFYFLPTRLWEMLIGSVCALHLLRQPLVKSNKSVLHLYTNQFASALGLFLILLSIIIFDETTPFPSFYALMPTLGTAFVILFASEKTFTGIFLSNKLFVGIGLISYSAYLWHQPIFAFARIRSIKEPNSQLMFTLGVLALALAYLTWKYVEIPFRDKTKFSRKKIFQLAVMLSIVMISIGVVGYLADGVTSRVAPNGMRYSELEFMLQPNFGLYKACDTFITIELCNTGKYPEILVWGDSYAMHLVPGILASNPDAKIIQMTKGACGPILGISRISRKYPQDWAEDCIEFNQNVITWLSNNNSVQYAFLSSPFTLYITNDSNILNNDKIIPAGKEIALINFERTLDALVEMGITPVVFAPPPRNGEDLSSCYIKNMMYEGFADCRFAVSEFREYSKEVLEFLEHVEKKYKVIYFSDVLCDDVFCNTELDRVLFYRDNGHLSRQGSEYLGKKMDLYKLITSK